MTRLTLWAALCTLARAQLAVDAGSQCACPMAQLVENDCFMYGANPNGGGLAAYPKVKEACLAGIEATDRYITGLDFWIMCPYANHTDYDIEEFVILLRQETQSEPAQFVMSKFIDDMDFPIFEEDNGVYGIPDVITNNLQGLVVNCTEQENECWNQVKAQMRERYPRFGIICTHWHSIMIPQFYQEQGRARRMLCEGGFNETQIKECDNVIDAIADTTNCAALESQVTARESGVPLCNETTVDSGAMPTFVAWSMALGAVIVGALV